ncbi:fructose 1,6-bisphosphatase [Porphyromonas crevioricanis]|uniref:Fructose-1,6-bisphosphatase class 3 n=2 Tax=Porphyromonas crevioricanis TaxID=393921 RepID=A0AB34PFE3_9PORP|nr:fructose-bisphosphatase class III [Porphyromonas crevioricanis]KGN91050.1 fructose 1,6-bisphosphatase [Porphyromonas crevioricanis]KGN94646.1 fructose 1,6-bisphosphatase [Porphyromonas crevioricanis]GAD06017.1 Fructose-1,6-bisphosphatase, Bacillus type [Porphyromonas crevioricanis JCM 15906]SJZ57161.1 fructose-1,6-bisphosphatase-3 [Porphyromonas crevioricanis]
MQNKDLKFLHQLAKSFPTAAEAATEIINLEAILSLPKGTEHFLADVHGEYEAFNHVLKNASGSIARKVENLFGGQIRQEEKRELCTLIYYPQEKLAELHEKGALNDDWYMVTLNQLVKLCRKVGEKYTRSKVRKALPPKYSYIIQELLHEDGANPQKSAYFSSIFSTILQIGKAEDFIIAICNTIQRLVVDHLHIVGDIYDRGPGPQHIMDTLMNYHQFDIQWGNHDMLWMGAAAGNAASMANTVRIALRYANLDTMENGYGINILPLARFAMETYANDPCAVFQPKLSGADELYDEKSVYLISQMHKAMSVIQFKLEHELIVRHPEYKMADRDLLHRIDFKSGSITLPSGETYPMLDTHFPTIDPKDPYRMTEEESIVVNKLMRSFRESERLNRHMECFYRKGSMYLPYNMTLLYHASVPLNEDKTLKEVTVEGKTYKGKALYDKIDELVRRAHNGQAGSPEQLEALDYMWYLWCGPDSPLFDKSAMTTFERYFIEDKTTHHEQKGWYFVYRQEQEVCEMILKEFGLEGPDTHIVNGHVPVKAKKGEKPLLAGGKLMLIDGGFSRAYQSSTGIAGYTLIFNSQGLQLVQHEPFTSKREAVENMRDIKSVSVVREHTSHRILVRDTDKGKELIEQVKDLKDLLEAYRYGLIQEKDN